jgi:cephalosporin hydroxylase
MNLLEELAIEYGTDKQMKSGHGYTEVYHNLFNSLRLNKMKVMELGVREGWSINMWAEYFPNSEIWCIDNNAEGLCPSSFECKRINFHLCSQDDQIALSKIHEQSGDYDIIIDDCSHISHLTIASFEIMYPFLKKGGLYIIEDLHTCDWKEYNPIGPTTIEYIKSKQLDYTFYNKMVVIRK